MESLSRSSHRRKHSTTAANVFSSSFSFKNPYGDVLLSNGGERKSLQAQEYTEIFSGSSSIPVLDLSGLDERVGSGDYRSSKLDYTNIFGGLTHDDVFLPHEKLVKGVVKKAKTRIPAEGQSYLQESGSQHSSRKMERPHGVASVQSVGVKLQESGSLPSTVKTASPTGVASNQSVFGVKLQESDSPHPSRKIEKPSGVASDQSVDGVEHHLNMSFNSTNHRNSDATDAKAPSGKLPAVPGFTHFVGGNRPHKIMNDRPPLPKREVSRTWSFSAEVEPASSKGGSSFENSPVHDKSHNVNKVNIKSQLSLEPMPSSYPSNPSDIKEPRQLRASDFASKGDVHEKVTSGSTEEFEDNSVDAVSAATLKKAIEQAQESIRIAKMIMERKKDGLLDGSKSRPISSLKVADRETKIEASGSKDSSTSKICEELDPVFPVPAVIDGKSTPSPSPSGACIDAWENVETDRGHEDAFADSCKLFASNHIQSEATHVAKNVRVEKLEKVEAAQEQREAKNFPGCGAIDLEPAVVGSISSLTPSTSEVGTNIGWSEMGKESFEWRNVTANHTKGSGVVPELMEGAISTSQLTQGMERNLVDELCHARYGQAEEPVDNEGRVLNSSQRIYENCKVVDETSASSSVGQEDGVNDQRENDRNGQEQHGMKLEECDKMFNERSEFDVMLNSSRNLVEEQEEMEKKTESVEGDDRRHAQTYDEEIRGARRTEVHLCENKELLKELLLEVFNKGKVDVLPEVGEFKNIVDKANEPLMKDNKQKDADDGDEPKSPEELVHNQVEEEHAKTSEYEAARTIMLEANQFTNVQESGTISETEKMDNTLRCIECPLEEAAYGEDIDEAVNVSCSEASRIFDTAHTNETINITAETRESCHVESSSKSEDQKPAKNSEENVPKADGAVSAADKDNVAEQSFNLQDDEMLRTNYMHRSASEEIFVENKLHFAYEGLPSDSRTEDVILDRDPEENLEEDGDVSKTTNFIHAPHQEYATEINIQDIPEVNGSHIRTEELDPADVEQVLEQTTESDEGSLSVSSFEKIDEFSAQETEECAGNLKDTTSNEEELRDEMISDGKKCAEEVSEGLCSQLHDEPKEMVKPLETEEALDTDVDVEKDKENRAGMPPMEEGDVKEGGQNFESNDQQQRIEAIKRGREREKDRKAVERAIREARERAFAEVRERAERAAVERAATEVRQKIMGDGREKAEKASVVKQPVDKASTEAKLRAERAAVERATVEARERALEKARSQKISEEWRTPADRHSTERFSSSSRNNVLKHSFSSSDLENGMNNESAQRRKARLERHQRIMERAAKALAEKNMRDLLAQKEQAERNRFAETLDADIKRWATGKEGNLRALLSTLHYILGPESGWQPVSLTEIITTAAVKKAYRKATLCVHPDKLQQRGASVQQKYVCEKVFDLLKAAWNRFNSDVR